MERLKINRDLKLIFIYYALIFFHFSSYCASAVTYDLAGGRLGDQLIGFMHAEWVSHLTGLPVLYKQFPYSDQFAFHDLKKPVSDASQGLESRTLEIGQSLENFLNTSNQNTLFVIPYFPESHEEYLATSAPSSALSVWGGRKANSFVHFDVNWKDPEFKKRIQKSMAPRYPLQLITPPKNKISIAIHVRKNSNGFDFPLLSDTEDSKFNPNQIYSDVLFPLKTPPESYYIEQLKKIIAMFPNEDMYVFIFTDDQHPQFIVENFKKVINNAKIEFDHRRESTNHFTNVLEDLFSMTKFDCFIRPDSNLSIVASKLGDFRVLIYPKHHHWEGRKLIIDEVFIERG